MIDAPRELPLHDQATIETPEQLAISLPLAGIGTRAAAYLIDLAWQVVPIVLVGVIAAVLIPVVGGQPTSAWVKGPAHARHLSLLAVAIFGLVTFAVNFGYFTWFEVKWKGSTPGKQVMGLRVVRDGGFPIDGRSAFIRNLLRAVDFLPSYYVLGMGVVFGAAAGKRIGDFAAGTLVVREAKAAALAMPTEASLPAEERDVIALLLSRQEEMNPAEFADLCSQMAERVATLQGRTFSSTPVQFLEELVRGERG